LVVYTDGSARGSNLGPAGAGFFIPNVDVRLRKGGYAALGITTNNRAEVMAIYMVIRALSHVHDTPKKIVIATDSKYAIGTLSLGHSTRANPRLIEATKRALASSIHSISFIKVPAHCGVSGNEIADRIANIGTDRSAVGEGVAVATRVDAQPPPPPVFLSPGELHDTIAATRARPPLRLEPPEENILDPLSDTSDEDIEHLTQIFEILRDHHSRRDECLVVWCCCLVLCGVVMRGVLCIQYS
jgi:ribonuclease HI